MKEANTIITCSKVSKSISRFPSRALSATFIASSDDETTHMRLSLIVSQRVRQHTNKQSVNQLASQRAKQDMLATLATGDDNDLARTN